MLDNGTVKVKMLCLECHITQLPGLIHYDFGDCLRSCCNPAGEEALDLSSVYFDTDLCAAIVKGWNGLTCERFTVDSTTGVCLAGPVCAAAVDETSCALFAGQGGAETSAAAGEATCGSAECRMACPAGGAATEYDSIAKIWYVALSAKR